MEIGKFSIDNVIVSVEKHRDTTLLIQYLRSGGEVTPILAQLIAGVLDGSVRAKPKQTLLNRRWIKFELDNCKAILRGESDVKWEYISDALKNVGYTGDLVTKADINKAAMMFTCHLNGLTLSQLEELLYPRSAKKRKREA